MHHLSTHQGTLTHVERCATMYNPTSSLVCHAHAERCQEQLKRNTLVSRGLQNSLQVAEAAQDADQVRGRVLRAGRPGVQAHHEALAEQLGGAAGAQPRARQPPVEGRHDHRLLHSIAKCFTCYRPSHVSAYATSRHLSRHQEDSKKICCKQLLSVVMLAASCMCAAATA
jgi:hypothetical protein